MTVICDWDGHDGEAGSTGSPNVAKDCTANPPHIVCDIHVTFEGGRATCPVCNRVRRKP